MNIIEFCSKPLNSKKMKANFTIIYLLILTSQLVAQVTNSSDLYKTIKEKDSLLFNLGFNKCDIQQFENLLSDEFTFYHDQNGISHSKQHFIEGIKNGICNLPYKPKRVLDQSTMEVYPLMKDEKIYGAIQKGDHHFYAIENNSSEYLSAIAKFSHLWILENGKWKLRQGISYDHQDFEKPINKELLFTDRKETQVYLKQKNIPAVGIAYIENGEISQISVFGELQKGIKAPLNTIWNVASLTKPITALVALKLVDSGELSLDEPLYKYYADPDIIDDPRIKKLSLRIILSHQTGFANYRGNYEDHKLKFEFEPGTKYQYSGEGYEYLRKVLESKFKKPLEQLADELIFSPLQMNDTRFVWNQEMDASRFAKWHTADSKLYPIEKSSTANAADNLLTTIEDYARFMVYIINGAGLSKHLQKEMTKNQVSINKYQYFGLGWWIDKNINYNNDFAMVHGGDDIGVHTIAFIIPKTKQGLLIFTNSDNGTEVYADIILKYLGENGRGIMEVEMKKLK